MCFARRITDGNVDDNREQWRSRAREKSNNNNNKKSHFVDDELMALLCLYSILFFDSQWCFFSVHSADIVVFQLLYVSLVFIFYAIVVVIVILLFFLAVFLRVSFFIFHFSFCAVVAIVKSAMFESHLRSLT